MSDTGNNISIGKDQSTSVKVTEKKEKQYHFSFKGGLHKLKTKDEIVKCLIAAAQDAGIPESNKQDLFNFILSNKFIINLDDQQDEKGVYAIFILANMMSRLGYKLNNPHNFDECVELLMQFKKKLVFEGKVTFKTEEEKKLFLEGRTISPAVQVMLLSMASTELAKVHDHPKIMDKCIEIAADTINLPKAYRAPIIRYLLLDKQQDIKMTDDNNDELQINMVIMLANMLARINPSYKLEKLTNYEQCVAVIKKFKEDQVNTRKVQFDDKQSADIYINSKVISKNDQTTILSLAADYEGQFKRYDSNDVPEKSPTAALLYILWTLKYDIKGISRSGNYVEILNATLSAREIGFIIDAFREGKYNISFNSPDYKDIALPLLEQMKNSVQSVLLSEITELETIPENQRDDQQKQLIANLRALYDSKKAASVIDNIIGEVKRKGPPSKDQGLSSDDINDLLLIQGAYSSANRNSPESDALNIIVNSVKKVEGLSTDDINKLVWLKKEMEEGRLPPIIIGRTKSPNKGDALDDALKVLERIGQDIAAISVTTQGKSKDKRGLLGSLFFDFKSNYVDSMSSKNERKVANTGAPQNYIPALKYELYRGLNGKVQELADLSVKLFGEDSKSGMLGGNKVLMDINQKIQDLDKEYDSIVKILHQYSDPESQDPDYSKHFKRINEIADEDNKLRDLYKAKASSIDFKGASKMLERYYYLVNYLTSDEIDYNFLLAFRETYGSMIMNKEFDLVDPYSGKYIKGTLAELIYNEKDKNSVINKFKRGEKWSSTGIVVGEGAKDEKILLAKQLFNAAVSYINLTNENVKVTGPIAYIAMGELFQAVPYIKFPAQMIAIMMEKGRIRSGEKNYESSLKNDLVSKVKRNILQGMQQQAGTQYNFNYGLSWKYLLINNVEDPAKYISTAFGKEKDVFTGANIISENDIDEIIKYTKTQYTLSSGQNTDKTQMSEEDLNKIKKEVASVRNKLKYQEISKDSQVLKDLVSLKGVLNKYGITITLEEKHLDDAFIKGISGKVTDKADLDIIKNGLTLLRSLLMDQYTIMGAMSKATTTVKGKVNEPISEALFGTDKGNSLEFAIAGDESKLPTDKVKMEFSLKKYLKETPVESLSFKYAMRWWNIPAGFIQTFSFFYDGIKAKANDPIYKGLIAKVFGYNEDAQIAFEQGWELFSQTAKTFFSFEYMPQYIVSEGINNIRHGEVAKGVADLTVSLPFFADASRRLYSLVSNPLKWLLGLRYEPYKVWLQRQGMTGRFVAEGTRIILTPLRVLYYRVTGTMPGEKPLPSPADLVKHVVGKIKNTEFGKNVDAGITKFENTEGGKVIVKVKNAVVPKLETLVNKADKFMLKQPQLEEQERLKAQAEEKQKVKNETNEKLDAVNKKYNTEMERIEQKWGTLNKQAAADKRQITKAEMDDYAKQKSELKRNLKIEEQNARVEMKEFEKDAAKRFVFGTEKELTLPKKIFRVGAFGVKKGLLTGIVDDIAKPLENLLETGKQVIGNIIKVPFKALDRSISIRRDPELFKARRIILGDPNAQLIERVRGFTKIDGKTYSDTRETYEISEQPKPGAKPEVKQVTFDIIDKEKISKDVEMADGSMKKVKERVRVIKTEDGSLFDVKELATGKIKPQPPVKIIMPNESKLPVTPKKIVVTRGGVIPEIEVVRENKSVGAAARNDDMFSLRVDDQGQYLYKVQENEDLNKIILDLRGDETPIEQAKLNTLADEMIRLNNISDPSKINVGQELNVPNSVFSEPDKIKTTINNLKEQVLTENAIHEKVMNEIVEGRRVFVNDPAGKLVEGRVTKVAWFKNGGGIAMIILAGTIPVYVNLKSYEQGLQSGSTTIKNIGRDAITMGLCIVGWQIGEQVVKQIVLTVAGEAAAEIVGGSVIPIVGWGLAAMGVAQLVESLYVMGHIRELSLYDILGEKGTNSDGSVKKANNRGLEYFDLSADNVSDVKSGELQLASLLYEMGYLPKEVLKKLDMHAPVSNITSMVNTENVAFREKQLNDLVEKYSKGNKNIMPFYRYLVYSSDNKVLFRHTLNAALDRLRADTGYSADKADVSRVTKFDIQVALTQYYEKYTDKGRWGSDPHSHLSRKDILEMQERRITNSTDIRNMPSVTKSDQNSAKIKLLNLNGSGFNNKGFGIIPSADKK